MPTFLSKVAQGVLLALALASAASAFASPAQQFESKQLREDFQIAREALEQAHGGIYRYTTQAELNRVFDGAQQALDHPMDAMALYRVMSPAVAALRCGHTNVLLSAALRGELEQALLLPLNVKLLDGRLFILRDFANGGALAGREVEAINGVPIAQILANLMARVAGDGDITTGRAETVGRQFKEILFTQMGMQGSFELALHAIDAGARDVVRLRGQTLPALRQAALAQFPQDQHSKRFTELSFFDEGRIARLNVYNFIDEEEDEDGATLLKKIFESIQAKGAHTLIIDLRDNHGGEDALGKLLFSYLVDERFRYYDDLVINRAKYDFAAYAEKSIAIPEQALLARPDGRFNLRAHPNLGLQSPGLPSFRGRVLVLINGGSFSTTAEFITHVHARKRATFIGEESGGGYFGNSSGHAAILVLPNSKLRVVVPLVTYNLAVKAGHAPARGVTPDYPVQPSIQHYLAGTDPAWTLALSLARKP